MNAQRALAVATIPFLACCVVHAQDNYEIQVYGSDTVKKGSTMVELHSNYTIGGPTGFSNGVRSQKDAFHETLEITHGFSETFETGFYIFTAYQRSFGWNVVGSHVRPRWRVPESWNWKVGASLSLEFGFQRRDFAEDATTFEIRPIIDKEFGAWYVAFNPALEKSIQGVNAGAGFEFSPNFKVAYQATKKATVGLEYYGSVGPVTAWDSRVNQTHQLFPSLDLDLGEAWEFNFGVGFGLSHSSDPKLIKMIVGRRMSF